MRVISLQVEAPDEVEAFVEYFESTWVGGRYRISMWNHHASEGPRTNSVEGWHSKLSKVSARNHPNLYEVIELLKREQASVEVKVTRLTAGGRAPKRRAAIKMDERIQQ